MFCRQFSKCEKRCTKSLKYTKGQSQISQCVIWLPRSPAAATFYLQMWDWIGIFSYLKRFSLNSFSYQSNRRTDLRKAWKGLRFIRISFDRPYTIWRGVCKRMGERWMVTNEIWKICIKTFLYATGQMCQIGDNFFADYVWKNIPMRRPCKSLNKKHQAKLRFQPSGINFV